MGDRVQTHKRSSQTAIDDSWRSVQLVLADEDNPLHLFNVTLLRPADWWASLGVEEVGDELFFELEELNVRGVGGLEWWRSIPGLRSRTAPAGLSR